MEFHNSTITAFYSLLRSGLWEKIVQIDEFDPIDFDILYKLSEEQSVVGLIAAGLELVEGRKITKKEAVPFLKKVIGLETRNIAMNRFIGTLVDQMRSKEIFLLLVKGQGIAQCYERPLWRSAGDVDLLLSDSNYQKAKAFLTPMATYIEPERNYTRHLGMKIDSWIVELHGSSRCGLSARIDKELDSIQKEAFVYGDVRVWKCEGIDVFLPGPDTDIVFVFIHFFNHFYKGGIGLRQICDWCRLLWTYRDRIIIDLLESRLRKMHLLNEWKAFAAFAVHYLGMPNEAMPLYDSHARWLHKADRISRFILKVGSFGKNRDHSYLKKYPYFLRKSISLFRRLGDLFHHATIFPDSFFFLPVLVYHGLRSAIEER